VALAPKERARLILDGCLVGAPLLCAGCRLPIEPADPVHCNDGYDRIYGEFVLDELDDLHEDNWPATHRRCAERAHAAPSPADPPAAVPRAVVVHGGPDLVRLARARLLGAGALGAVVTVAGGTAAWAGVSAGVVVMGAGAAVVLVAWGVAARLHQ
jgi:hypothetical protein